MKKSDEVKNLIIANTRELMRKKGNITIKDIAEKSYVNIAAVNYYFGDKENLISIVTKQIVEELKQEVFLELSKLSPNDKVEDTLVKMIDIIYRFALENVGIISYMFLYPDTQKATSNLLIDEFLSYNDFTEMIVAKMKETNHKDDEKTLYARYMLLFSSCCIPMFIEILKQNGNRQFDTASLQDDEFRKLYINELMHIIKRN